MKSILIVCNDFDYFRRHRLALAQILAVDNHVFVVTGGRQGANEQEGGIIYRHIEIDRFSFRPVTDLAFFIRIFLLIRELRPSALHLITLKPAVFGGLASIFAKWCGFGPGRVVVTIPGLGRLMTTGHARLAGFRADIFRCAVGTTIKLLSSQKATRYTFETEHDRRVWIDDGLIQEDNSVVLRGAGVDPVRYSPRQTGAPREPLRIVFASRLLKAKGLEAFLVAARMSIGRDDVRFTVAGMIEAEDPDGYSTEGLRADTSIEFLGEVADMPALLRQADVVCLPTLYGEGIPRILIEAAACGLAAIGTRTPGCREIILDGKTGLLLDVADTQKMAIGILRCIDTYLKCPGLLRQHGDAAREHFLTGGFQESEVIAGFVKLLCKPDLEFEPTLAQGGDS